MSSNYDEIKSQQTGINKILILTEKMKSDLDTILIESNTKQSDYNYFPLLSKYHTIILMFSHEGDLKHHLVVPLREVDKTEATARSDEN